LSNSLIILSQISSIGYLLYFGIIEHFASFYVSLIVLELNYVLASFANSTAMEATNR